MFCNESFRLQTVSSNVKADAHTLVKKKNKQTFATDKLSKSELWDIQKKGVRIFIPTDGMADTVKCLLDTLLLFVPLIPGVKSIPDFSAKRNLDFLKKQIGMDMPPRSKGTSILKEEDIHSGDHIQVMRLDGLDPMAAWGMGSGTGHVTVAIWEDNQLQIAESTAKDAYWPNNGIQRTPYKQWMDQATSAQ